MAEDKRNCTDILFFCLFILFNLVWIYIAIWSIAKQNVGKLIAPLDDDGNFCGYDDGYEDYP